MDMQTASAPASVATTSPVTAHAGGSHFHLWAGQSFSFHDVLDAINPLQHLPIIATIYRHLTHETIGNAARVVGDTIYGGPIGFAMSLLNAHVVDTTGTDIGDHVLAMVEGSKSKAPAAAPAAAAAAVAASSPSAPPQAASSGAMSMAAALAALPSRPPIDLPYFPGAAATTAAAPDAATATPTPATATAAAAPTASPGAIMPQNALPANVPPASIPPTNVPTAALKPLAPALKSYAIDTSSSGIAAMRAHPQSADGVPFQLPAGIMLTNQPQPIVVAPVSTADFAQKMKQGLAKYQALLAQQAGQHPLAAQPAS